MRLLLFPLLAVLAACHFRTAPDTASLAPLRGTVPVPDDADDPAIWIDRDDPSRSIVLGTNKVSAPNGALYVFALDGTIRQTIAPLDRPNNVDVEYGLAAPGGAVDIAVVTERLQHRLRVFRVDRSGLSPLDGGAGIPVLEGMSGEGREPMGIALYRRPRDGAIFAIVAPKTGAAANYLWQYRLEADAVSGQVRGTLVRRFGHYSGTAEIEAIAVDDELGYVYYSDEEFGIRKWQADPESPEAWRELAVFGRRGFERQREGLAIFAAADGTGFIVCADQIPGGTVLRLYPREGRAGRPHAHEPAAMSVRTRADSTDGLDVVSSGLAAPFAGGLLVMMNSDARNFLLFPWDDVMRANPR